MTNPHFVSVPVFVALATLAATAVVPARLATQTPGAVRRSQVFVVDFGANSLPPDFGKLEATASELMRIALLEVPRLEPISTRQAPECRSFGFAQLAVAPQRDRGDFYVVTGWITGSPNDVLLEYAVDRCVSGSGLSPVFQETVPLGRASLLDDLARAARQVTGVIRRQFPKAGVSVGRFARANPRDSNETVGAAQVEQELREAVWASSDYDVTDSAHARYRVGGQVAIRPGDVPGSHRSIEIQINVVERNAPPASLTAISDARDLREAAASAARQTLDFLDVVKYRDSAVSTADIDETTLLARAMDLLCASSQRGCSPDTTRAIAVLKTATERPNGDWVLLGWLGRLSVTRDPASADRSLSRALDLIEMEQRGGRAIEAASIMELLNAQADALRRLGDFAAAADQYGKSLALMGRQPDIRLQHVSSLRLAGKPAAALTALTAALRDRPEDKALHREGFLLVGALGNVDTLERAPLDSLVTVLGGGRRVTVTVDAGREEQPHHPASGGVRCRESWVPEANTYGAELGE